MGLMGDEERSNDDEGGAGWGSGGSVRSAVDQALSGLDLDASGRITAVLARSAASLMDSCRMDVPRLWLATAARLVQWLGVLGVMDREPSGDSLGGVPAEVAAILDRKSVV